MTEGASIFPSDPATRRYSSYLLRCWRLDGGALRVQVEHIQSGARTRVDTLTAALAWIGQHTDEKNHRDQAPVAGGAASAAPEV